MDEYTRAAAKLFNVPEADVTDEMRSRAKTIGFAAHHAQPAIDPDTLPAGRELDVLVAETVMGWYRAADAWIMSDGLRTIEPSSFGSFQPSTDIAAAWEVAEKLPGFGMTHMRDGTWHVAFGGGQFPAHADTAPLAICRAALKAVAAQTAKEA